MGKVSVALAADAEAVEMTAPCSTPGRGTDSSRASFSISSACINGMALSNTASSAYSPGLGLCWDCQQPAVFMPQSFFSLFYVQLNSIFLGRSASHGVGACQGCWELWLLIWAALVAWDVKGLVFCLHFASLSKITSPFPLNKFSCAGLGWSVCTWSLHAQAPHTAGSEALRVAFLVLGAKSPVLKAE